MEVVRNYQNKIVINEESSQNWLPLTKYVPSKFGTFDIKGDYSGRYLCMVERPYVKSENQLGRRDIEHTKTISKSIEMCYWNDLVNRFQDSSREWVKVTHWSPVPNSPEHEIIDISIEEMLYKIEVGILQLVDYIKQSDNLITDDMWNIVKNCALYSVSYDEPVYLSTIYDENDLEICRWSIKI